jgi:hypothetical protein
MLSLINYGKFFLNPGYERRGPEPAPVRPDDEGVKDLDAVSYRLTSGGECLGVCHERSSASHPNPKPGTTGTNEKDAKDVVEYLGFLMQVVYNLPHQIEHYRARKKKNERGEDSTIQPANNLAVDAMKRRGQGACQRALHHRSR